METFSYSWEIPTTAYSHADLLCTGYLRHRISSTVLNNIKTLCINYLNNINILNEIKTGKPGSRFCSPIFEHSYCKWMIEFYPRGSEEYDTEETCEIYLALTSLSPSISSLKCECSLLIPEINFNVDRPSKTLSRYSLYYFFMHDADTDINADLFKQCDKITLNLKINIIKIQNHDNKTLSIADKSQLQHLTTKQIIDNFKWKINTQQPESILFKMHSLSWCLQLIPDEDSQRERGSLQIQLATLPAHAIAYMHYDLICKDIGWQTNDLVSFRMWSLSKAIHTTALFAKNIQQFECITIEFVVKLIDIFDENGNNITNRYIDNHQPSAEIITDILSHHTWKLPAISTKDAMYLCNGYIREQCINIYIPFDISQLITLFFDDDKDIVNGIKNAEKTEGCKSNIFSIGGFKWYLDVYPRGYSGASDTIESYLNLVSLSDRIFKVVCWYKWRLCETNSFKEDRFNFTNTSLSTNVAGYILPVTDIQNVESLTFELDLFILNVLDENRMSLDNYQKYQDSNILSEYIDSFEWRLNAISMQETENVQSDEFSMHSLKWNMELMKSDALKVKLILVSLPSNIRVWTNLTLRCEDIDVTVQSEGVEFYDENMEETMTLLTQFEKNKDITLKMVIELMDVYDENGYCITEEYCVFP